MFKTDHLKKPKPGKKPKSIWDGVKEKSESMKQETVEPSLSQMIEVEPMSPFKKLKVK